MFAVLTMTPVYNYNIVKNTESGENVSMAKNDWNSTYKAILDNWIKNDFDEARANYLMGDETPVYLENLLRQRLFHSRIADLSCGFGYYHLNGVFHGFEITGLDFSVEALKAIKKFYCDNDYVAGDLLYLPFKKNIFDLVLCIDVLYSFNDDDAVKVLLQISSIAKKGEKVIIVSKHNLFFLMRVIFAAQGIKKILKTFLFGRGNEVKGKFVGYRRTVNEYRRIIKNGGLKLSKARGLNHFSGCYRIHPLFRNKAYVKQNTDIEKMRLLPNSDHNYLNLMGKLFAYVSKYVCSICPDFVIYEVTN